MWDFLSTLLSSWLSLLFSLFGPLLIFGLILYLFARFTRILYRRSAGTWLDALVTGWIGTPVHETGHAVFCLLFGHRITDMRLFSPNPSDGTLGYVIHSYNKKNIYHRAGNFFIGFGPIIFGAAVIFLLMTWMVPANGEIKNCLSTCPVSFAGFNDFFSSAWNAGKCLIETLFCAVNMKSFMFWLFLYACFSIASHMELSPPDLRTVWSGFIIIAVLILIILAILMAVDTDTGFIDSYASSWLKFSGMYVLVTTLSALNLVASFLLINLISIPFKGKFVHPF
ncbi:MAG: hypothetical protein ABIJ16_10780 [Bacteroidota bacterium]